MKLKLNFCLTTLLVLTFLLGSCNKKKGSIFDDVIRPGPPVKVHVKSVTISGIQDTMPNGRPWDLDSNPDIRFTLSDIKSNQSLWRTEFIQNADPALPHTFVPDSIIMIDSPLVYYRWSVWEGGDDELLGDYRISGNTVRFFNFWEEADVDTIAVPKYLSSLTIKFAVDYEY